jgi:hypothetical protein
MPKIRPTINAATTSVTATERNTMVLKKSITASTNYLLK